MRLIIKPAVEACGFGQKDIRADEIPKGKSLHFEKLKGNRSHQHSMRLDQQWRLIREFDGSGAAKIVCIAAIEDYH